MINSKRGVESVEVWMWIIAGLIIGTIVFGGSYTLFAHWIHNNELKDTKANFQRLTQAIADTCNRGTDNVQIDRFIFPKIVKNITIKNKETSKQGTGLSLCIIIDGEGEFCNDLDMEKYECNIPAVMKSISFEETKGLFSIIQKALKGHNSKNVDFMVTKTKNEDLCIYWDIKFEDSEIDVKPDLLDEESQCSSNCQCGEELLCDEFGYCCPEKYYFDGSKCVPYYGNGVCDIHVYENCQDEPGDCVCSENQCCYDCNGADDTGCCPEGKIACGYKCIEKPTQPLQPKDKCSCSAECGSNLLCVEEHCACEDGFVWNRENKKCEEPVLCGDDAKLGYLVEYAQEYVGCPYSLTLVQQTTPQNCRPNGLTCATFVSSVVTGKTSYTTFYGHGYQKCTVNVNEGRAKMVGTNVNKLEPGDIFQAGGSPVGHTGMYVGKGTVSQPISYFGIRTCYKNFECDPNGKPIIIHSIGNSNEGQPGVCYEPYDSLFNAGRYNNYQFCRVIV